MLTHAAQIELDTLREENRQLRDVLRPNYPLPRGWRLTPKEAVAVRAIRAAAPGICSHERLNLALYGFDDEPASSTASVLVHRARKKLTSHGIAIGSAWGHGYIMPPEACRLYDAAGAAVAALMPEPEPKPPVGLAHTFRVFLAPPTLRELCDGAMFDALAAEGGSSRRAALRLGMGHRTLCRRLAHIRSQRTAA